MVGVDDVVQKSVQKASKLTAGMKFGGEDLDPQAQRHLLTATLLAEISDVETRLRHHTLELVEPSIQRQRQMETKQKDLKGLVDSVVAEGQEMRRSIESVDGMRKMIENVHQQLAEWERQRREWEQCFGDRESMQDLQITELTRAEEQKKVEQVANNRMHKTLSESIVEVRVEMEQMKECTYELLSDGRDKLAKLRCHVEEKEGVMFADLRRLCDGEATLQRIVNSVTSELDNMALDVNAIKKVVDVLSVEKASTQIIEQYQLEFSETVNRIDTNANSLAQEFRNLVDDVKNHFQTAQEVVTVHSAREMAEMRDNYQRDVERVQSVLSELDAFMERHKLIEIELRSGIAKVAEDVGEAHEEVRSSVKQQMKMKGKELNEIIVEVQQMRRHLGTTVGKRAESNETGGVGIDMLKLIIESSLLGVALDEQDNEDRKNIALYGCKNFQDNGGSRGSQIGKDTGGSRGRKTVKLPELTTGDCSSTPRRKRESLADDSNDTIVTLDKRCLACSGSQSTVMAGFKLACLHYEAGPVEYQKVKYTRSELIKLRADLLNQVRESLDESG